MKQGTSMLCLLRAGFMLGLLFNSENGVMCFSEFSVDF
jgi:hypothetical protein